MSEAMGQARAALRACALALPGAQEDFPWEESVIKVNKKVFVFFGLQDKFDERLFLGVKLPQTGVYAVQMAFVKPMGYGLGKHGWVQAELGPDDAIPLDLLLEWIEESYRAVAPKRLVAQIGPPVASAGLGSAAAEG